jgi:Kazal-type serine protease inhibitor domain
MPAMATRLAFAAMLTVVALADARAEERPTDKRRPDVCTEQYAPVCGQKGSVRKTYSNACFAAADGATVTADGPCR